ncbi:unnamed protein product [Caenorhabditis brenneri]
MIRAVSILLISTILVVDAQNPRCASCTNITNTDIIKVTNTYNNANGCKVIEQTCAKTGCIVTANVLDKATRAVLQAFPEFTSNHSVEMVCGQDPQNPNSYSYLYDGIVAVFNCKPYCGDDGGDSGNVEDNFSDSTSTVSTTPASTSTESTTPCVHSTTTEEPSTSTVVTTTPEPSTSQPVHGCHVQKKKK